MSIVQIKPEIIKQIQESERLHEDLNTNLAKKNVERTKQNKI